MPISGLSVAHALWAASTARCPGKLGPERLRVELVGQRVVGGQVPEAGDGGRRVLAVGQVIAVVVGVDHRVPAVHAAVVPVLERRRMAVVQVARQGIGAGGRGERAAVRSPRTPSSCSRRRRRESRRTGCRRCGSRARRSRGDRCGRAAGRCRRRVRRRRLRRRALRPHQRLEDPRRGGRRPAPGLNRERRSRQGRNRADRRPCPRPRRSRCPSRRQRGTPSWGGHCRSTTTTRRLPQASRLPTATSDDRLAASRARAKGVMAGDLRSRRRRRGRSSSLVEGSRINVSAREALAVGVGATDAGLRIAGSAPLQAGAPVSDPVGSQAWKQLVALDSDPQTLSGPHSEATVAHVGVNVQLPPVWCPPPAKQTPNGLPELSE